MNGLGEPAAQRAMPLANLPPIHSLVSAAHHDASVKLIQGMCFTPERAMRSPEQGVRQTLACAHFAAGAFLITISSSALATGITKSGLTELGPPDIGRAARRILTHVFQRVLVASPLFQRLPNSTAFRFVAHS
jgi:hypothetical protein